MTVPILTASAGAAWEAGFVSAVGADSGVDVVRRCVDTIELVSAASLRTTRVALVDARLPGMDRGVVTALQSSGVAIVAVAPDNAASSRLRLMGVEVVVADTADPAELLTALADAVAPPEEEAPDDDQPVIGTGQAIAVWGATGAPGRSTVAMSIADECAAACVPTLLVDADVYGGSLAQMLGILDEAPGLLAAARLANDGRLTPSTLKSCARALPSGLLVLTGITRPQRWTELRSESFLTVLDIARRVVDVIVVDCGFCIEQDEEIVFDTMAPRRNGVSVSALNTSDHTVLVVGADPVGLQRGVRAALNLGEEVPRARPLLVVNRLRRGPVPGIAPREQVSEILLRHVGAGPAAVIPSDPGAFDKALAYGRTLREVAPGSPARLALRDFTQTLVPSWRRRGTSR